MKDQVEYDIRQFLSKDLSSFLLDSLRFLQGFSATAIPATNRSIAYGVG